MLWTLCVAKKPGIPQAAIQAEEGAGTLCTEMSPLSQVHVDKFGQVDNLIDGLPSATELLEKRKTDVCAREALRCELSSPPGDLCAAPLRSCSPRAP